MVGEERIELSLLAIKDFVLHAHNIIPYFKVQYYVFFEFTTSVRLISLNLLN